MTILLLKFFSRVNPITNLAIFEGEILLEIKILNWRTRKKHTNVLVGELLSKVPKSVLTSGNRNRALSGEILWKIASEAKQKYDLDKNFHIFLCKLKLLNDEDENLKGKHVSGFTQEYFVLPSFSVTLFSEKQIKEMMIAKKTDI